MQLLIRSDVCNAVLLSHGACFDFATSAIACQMAMYTGLHASQTGHQ